MSLITRLQLSTYRTFQMRNGTVTSQNSSSRATKSCRVGDECLTNMQYDIKLKEMIVTQTYVKSTLPCDKKERKTVN